MRHARTLAGAAAAAVLLAACSTADPPPETPPATDEAPSPSAADDEGTTDAPSVEPDDQSLGPVAAPVRHPSLGRAIYFVMIDRFENGDPTNDEGGIPGGPLANGFLPTEVGWHHGGDLAGLTDRLDYIAGLGVGAIWVTPPFTNNPVQGDGTVAGSSSSYHGYWQVDLTTVDPHYGTDDELRAFVDAAHERGLEVHLDAVTNHTGDVVVLGDGSSPYFSTEARPYLDVDGNEVELAELAGLPAEQWPVFEPTTSFPHVPFAPIDVAPKAPGFLNDLSLYHNRGSSTFTGESVTQGDIFGLDDLMTEHPVVRQGMTDVYADIATRFGIDGFRIDTVKHVEPGFWEVWAPGVRRAAAAAGEPDLLLFGEVFDTSPILHTTYTQAGLSSTLDFILADALERYVADGLGGSIVAQAFDEDDWFTDVDGSAAQQVTFLGNHDVGRMAHLVARANPGADETELLARVRLANELLFTARGIPVVHYGDEQGFVGDGGDRAARQSMFPSIAPAYLEQDQLGTDATPGADNFDPTHPLHLQLQELTALRADEAALAGGAQVNHELDGSLVGWSRIDRDARVEHVVLASNDPADTVTAVVPTLTPRSAFEIVWGPGVGDRVTSDAAGALIVDVPPLSLLVLRAAEPVPVPDDAPAITLVRPDEGAELPTRRYRLGAELGDRRWAEVTFAVAVDGAAAMVVGVDDAPPYRVYWDSAAHADGATVEIIATVDDGSGRLRSDLRTVTLGTRDR